MVPSFESAIVSGSCIKTDISIVKIAKLEMITKGAGAKCILYAAKVSKESSQTYAPQFRLSAGGVCH